MTNPTYHAIQCVEDDKGVVTLTLNNPEKHNAFDDSLIAELTSALNHIEQSSTAKVMILAAKGKSFCAGADLSWMKRMADYSFEENQQDANALATMLFKLNTLRVPTIARVQGSAFGGGVGLIACCDMAISTKLSKFCLSEVKIGLIPATISPYVIESMGAKQCRRYFQTAEVFSARRARRLGLLSESVTEEELDSTVNTLVSACLNNSPQGMRESKKLIQQVKQAEIDSSLLAYTSAEIAKIRVSEEGQNGLNAFLNKSTPSWRQN